MHEVVVGVEGCCGVACHIVDHVPPLLWAKDVVNLNEFSTRSVVCVALLWGLAHPCLWETERVFHACEVQLLSVAVLICLVSWVGISGR